jgi:DNA replication protein DnaC
MPTASRSRTVDEKALRVLLEASGVPWRYLDCRIGSFISRSGLEEAIAATRAVIDAPANLLLVGPPGTGKTHLAVAILAARAGRALLDAGGFRWGSRFVRVPELVQRLRDRISDSSVPDPLRPLREDAPDRCAPIVVLDDLGWEYEVPREDRPGWVSSQLYELVESRYAAGLVTIVTSNVPLATLEERGYQPILSRLRQGGSVVRIDTSDYRSRADG